MSNEANLAYQIEQGSYNSAKLLIEEKRIKLEEIFPEDSHTFLHKIVMFKRGSSFNRDKKAKEDPVDFLKFFLEKITHKGMASDFINLKTKRSGNTPLHLAARDNSIRCISVLIEYGADINATNKEGYNALHIAASKGNNECVRVLLEKGALPNQITLDDLKKTALHLAVGYDQVKDPKALKARVKGHTECARNLLKKGALVNQQDSNGWTPLHVAAEKNNVECVKVLLEMCAPIDIKTVNGNTPLDLALQKGHENLSTIFSKIAATNEESLTSGTTETGNIALAPLSPTSRKRMRGDISNSPLVTDYPRLFKKAKCSADCSDTQKKPSKNYTLAVSDIDDEETESDNDYDSDDITLGQEEKIIFLKPTLS